MDGCAETSRRPIRTVCLVEVEKTMHRASALAGRNNYQVAVSGKLLQLVDTDVDVSQIATLLNEPPHPLDELEALVDRLARMRQRSGIAVQHLAVSVDERGIEAGNRRTGVVPERKTEFSLNLDRVVPHALVR